MTIPIGCLLAEADSQQTKCRLGDKFDNEGWKLLNPGLQGEDACRAA